MGDSMLTVENVTKVFGTHRAVSDLSFQVKTGEICGFLGPNGAGKTTTMRMIAGIIEPTSGTILVDGVSVTERAERTKRIVGYVPDRPYLYEKLTALEFLEFIAGIYGLEPSSAEVLAKKLLVHFGLSDVMGHRVESYSHGMKQRLVMSSVFLTQPKLLVVDEPMVGLDPAGAQTLKSTLKTQAREAGMGILLSTHSLDVAQEVCDKIVMIHRGRLVAQGTPTELNQFAQNPDGRLETAFLELLASENAAR